MAAAPPARSFADRLRPPSARPTHPLILLTGEELTGKSHQALAFTGSDKVGPAWVIQVGEADADPYGAIPGARFSIVEHDGTWPDLLASVAAAGEAARAALADDPTRPPVLIIDSMSQVWGLLATWAENRARSTDKARRELARDPNADVPVSPTYWNAANRRHRQLVTLLRAFPGVVVLTSRARWVTKMDAAGNPTREREYAIEAQKELGFRVTAWVRLSRDAVPQLVGLRHPGGGVNPMSDKPYNLPDFTLERLIFEQIGYDPAAADERREYAPVADDAADPSAEEAQPAQRAPLGAEATLARRPSPAFAVLCGLIDSAASRAELRAEVWPKLQAALKGDQMTRQEAAQARNHLEATAAKLPEQAGDDAEEVQAA